MRTPAKVNLFLEVTGKRHDGYHDVVTFMVAVTLFDALEFKEEPSQELSLTCDVPDLVGPENLVLKAARLLREEVGIRRGARMHLKKRIPLAAGLAGGSSDAATTLWALNRLWQCGLTMAELARLSSRLGSDVPFFLTARSAWCRGRGEIVRPMALPRPLDLVLACPDQGLATADVYRRVRVPSRPVAAAGMRRALRHGDVDEIGARLFNRLQPVAEELCPDVARLRETLATLRPAGHLMSGSGSTYFALCRDHLEARRLARQLRRRLRSRGNEKERGLRVFVVRTL